MFIRLFIIAIILLGPFVLIGQEDWQVHLHDGNTAYEQQQYGKALQHYQSAMTSQSEGQSVDLLFNLGNAHYKSGNLGQAILHWEKALVLSPNDKDIRENLRIAKYDIEGEVIPVTPFFLLKFWKSTQNLLSSSAWSILCIIMIWLGIMGLLVWLFSKERKMKKYGFIGGLTLLVLALFPLLWSMGKAKSERQQNRAILTVQKTALRSSPDNPGDFDIYEGTELEIMDRIGEWSKVRLLNSDVGWVKDDEYEII